MITHVSNQSAGSSSTFQLGEFGSAPQFLLLQLVLQRTDVAESTFLMTDLAGVLHVRRCPLHALQLYSFTESNVPGRAECLVLVVPPASSISQYRTSYRPSITDDALQVRVVGIDGFDDSAGFMDKTGECLENHLDITPPRN